MNLAILHSNLKHQRDSFRLLQEKPIIPALLSRPITAQILSLWIHLSRKAFLTPPLLKPNNH